MENDTVLKKMFISAVGAITSHKRKQRVIWWRRDLIISVGRSEHIQTQQPVANAVEKV